MTQCENQRANVLIYYWADLLMKQPTVNVKWENKLSKAAIKMK